MPPKDSDPSTASGPRSKTTRPRAIRRLVIWYRRNAAVTSLVGSATNSASAAGNVAGTVVSSAGSVVSNAGSMAGSMLQPLVFDPLRR
ncbi:MAG: phosphate acyltransferase PlsX, partial [Cyanobacteriota bacterium]|nr:phosphate acyltransferase PlsX [Cyanobacteriota bacterium]